jgi:hypothetical protein
MKNPKFWIAVLVSGIVANVIDFVGQGQVLASAYYSKIESMRMDTKPIWYIIGDFVAVLIFAWVLDRVLTVFGNGWKAGAKAGFYLGVLVNFPSYHFIFLMFKGYPYRLAWINTIYGIVECVIIGALLAALMCKGAAEEAPAKS